MTTTRFTPSKRWRRPGLALVLMLGLGATAMLRAQPPRAEARSPTDPASRPNLLVIVADDLGSGDVSAYGGDIATPSIDALAGGGIRFTDGYVTAPVCNPSRAALMTGRYQQRWGQEENEQTATPEGAPRGSLPQSETTLGTALRALGYRTGAIGKWHLGMQPGYHPLDRGFEEFFGMASGTSYVDRAWPGVHAFDELGKFDASEPPLDENALRDSPRRGLVRGREPAPRERYVTEQLAEEAVAFIDRHRAEPFFLYLSFNAPHAPLETTDAYYQRFPQFADERKRVYAAMISALDDGIGRVLARVREAGVENDTLVVLVSDNGAAEYVDSDGRRNAPLAGHKRTLYEGGVRLPFMVRWPARLPSGKTYSQPVSTLDLMPTLLAAAGPPATAAASPSAPAAGAPPARALDGVDLLPFLTGERKGAPHDALFWRTSGNAAVRKGDWKLLIAREETTGKEIVRLYDLSRDPGETSDLAAKKPAVVAELRALWAKWNEGLTEPRQSGRTVVTRHEGDSIRWQI
jgi:arylsulfatase A-like enzyme